MAWPESMTPNSPPCSPLRPEPSSPADSTTFQPHPRLLTDRLKNMSRHSRLLPALMGTALLCVLASCGGSDGTAPTEPDAPIATSVTISPSIATLDAVGATAPFTARVRDQVGREMTGVSVSWLSSDQGVATISSSGLATAIENGTTTIIAAASESVSGWATLNVELVDLIITSESFEAAIVGRALYERRFTLPEAIAAAS